MACRLLPQGAACDLRGHTEALCAQSWECGLSLGTVVEVPADIYLSEFVGFVHSGRLSPLPPCLTENKLQKRCSDCAFLTRGLVHWLRHSQQSPRALTGTGSPAWNLPICPALFLAKLFSAQSTPHSSLSLRLPAFLPGCRVTQLVGLPVPCTDC